MTVEEYIVQGFGSLSLENAKLRAENDALIKHSENLESQVETLRAALEKIGQ